MTKPEEFLAALGLIQSALRNQQVTMGLCHGSQPGDKVVSEIIINAHRRPAATYYHENSDGDLVMGTQDNFILSCMTPEEWSARAKYVLEKEREALRKRAVETEREHIKSVARLKEIEEALIRVEAGTP